ncbi:MAG: glycosyltransferase [Candidatus Micrarchaeota archaeon]
MKRTLDAYLPYCGQAAIDEIRALADRLDGQSVVHVNSTFNGGGVAEMLAAYIPLLNDAGIDSEWRLLKGNKEFFSLTKRLHNSLQGQREKFSKQDEELYKQALEENAHFTHLHGYDAVIVDDPQPAGFIDFYPRKLPSLFKPMAGLSSLREWRKKQVWIWRGHIDLSRPYPAAVKFMQPYLSKYDAYVLSSKKFRRPDKKKPYFIIPPAIDPLSEKNRPMEEDEIHRLLYEHGLEDAKPMIAQVSRFDPWKDPLGVIEAFLRIRKKFDCQLVLLGNFATDDAQGPQTYKEVLEAAQVHKDVHILAVESDALVNAVQRRADVVVQKSIREGFGLTVSEGLWKGRPVVASAVGGIKLQIKDGKSGYLSSNGRDFERKVYHLLKNPALGRKMGQAGWGRVHRHFLITRLVRDELSMLNLMLGSKPSLPLKEAAKILKLPLNGMQMMMQMASKAVANGAQKGQALLRD